MIRIFESPGVLFRSPHTGKQEYVMSIGNFDGIHRGHLNIIRHLQKLKKNHNAQSLIYSFREHPRYLLEQVHVPRIISLEDKLNILEAENVEALILRNFWEVAGFSWDEFWEKELSFLDIKAVVVGFNFRFGKKAAGHSEELKRLGNMYGFKVHVIEPLTVNEEIVSSTLIRKYIRQGDFEKVTPMLGRPYKVDGVVVPGDKIGQQIGFPTANLKVNRELLPAPGIYATTVRVGEKKYPAACYSGTCPTIKDKYHFPHIEVHILDFDENIYNQHIDVYFHAFIREDRQFNSIHALQKQIEKDIEVITNYFYQKK